MIFTSSALVAGLAITTHAFLLSPSVSSADTDIINTLPFEVEAQVDGQVLHLECSNCPVATWNPAAETGISWIQGVESKLQLNFSIAHNDVDALHLNNFQIYPPQSLLLEPLAALQITAEAKDADAVGYVRLGYELGIRPVMKSEQDQLELIVIHLQIVEIGGIFVDNLESVELKLIKTPTGKLMIADIATAPSTNPGGRDCKTLICELRAIVAEKLSHLIPHKGCGSKTGADKTLPAGGRHHSHGHRKHHGFGRLLHALKSIAFHVLIPVFIGIATGFTASMIGMFVGQTIIFLWRTFYRRGQKGAYTKVQQDESTDVGKSQDETKPFLEHQGPPPVYEDIVVVPEDKSSEQI